MDRRTAKSYCSVLTIVWTTVVALTLNAPVCLADVAPEDTLVLVNGDPITTGDLDQLIMEAHESFRSGDRSQGTAQQLLDNRVNDYLILQDAIAAGYDEEEESQNILTKKTREYAVGIYVRDNVDLPKSAPADSVRAFFERYYWQIQLRRLSVRTQEEAESLRARVAASADMDSLARELSLDTKSLRGGLYNLLYWADVENRIRDEVRGLKQGEISRVFPYNDAFTFVRVEQLLPVHEEAFARFEPSMIPVVHGQLRQRVWDEFLRDQTAKAGLVEDIGPLMAVIADSAQVLDGAFLKDQPEYVFEIEGGGGVTGTELRRTISYEAMQNALAPFGHHLTAARSELTNKLVLGALAEANGYFENAEVVKMVDKDWERDLISRYLDDHVTSKITFKREEFEALYEANKESLRGPDEVRLDVMILDEKEQAEEAASRLHDGADFGYIFGQYNLGTEFTVGSSNFIKETELSKSFQEPLADMAVGTCSQAIKMPMGYMVFRLDARRPGSLPPMEAVEMDIRRTLFKRNFDLALSKHISILKENSQIQWWPERIDAYLGSNKDNQ